MKPHRGTLVLVLGILSLVVCGPLGLVAWVLGSSDLKEMAAGSMDPAGRDLTLAGKICGMIATVLMAVGAVVAAVFVLLALLGAVAEHAH